ncbi:MFS transporter [Geomicrobium sp. JCM 19039]|uniref:MFS transporter n=1 Tax=Geomicrobium sp. JCM 19039 TaxID=1460636 RepID=UPI0006936B1A|nr:MFS transporter [Geomicrobium sp. JCM 19039]
MDSQRKKKLVLLLAILLTFTVINGTMFNVTIPDIAETFGLLPSQVSWVMTGYILVYAIGSVMYGKLADMVPLKTLLTVGILLFSLGSVLGFLSPNYGTLLAARILQALGGAAIPALGFIIPSRYFDTDRGKVFGIISSTVAFASGVGPIAGGMIGGVLEWRYLFLVPATACLAIPLFRKWLPDERVHFQKIDYIGAILVSVFVSTLLLFVTLFVWSLLFVSILSFWYSLFILIEATCRLSTRHYSKIENTPLPYSQVFSVRV